jgi:hypothetical protein
LSQAYGALRPVRVVDIALTDGSTRRCLTRPTQRVAALCHQAANPAAARHNHSVVTNRQAGMREINDLRAKKENMR